MHSYAVRFQENVGHKTMTRMNASDPTPVANPRTGHAGQTPSDKLSGHTMRAQGCTLVAAHYDPRRKNQGLHAPVGASLIKEGVCKRRQAVLQFKNELSFLDRDFFTNLQKAAPDEKEAPMRPQ